MPNIRHVMTSPKADVADATLVRPSDWNSSHAFTGLDQITIGGNTSGVAAVISSGTVMVAGGNNVTVSQDANSLTISAFNQSQQSQNIIREVSLSGNTAGVLADITSGTFYMAGGNNITLSQNANSVTISAFTQSAESQSAGMSNIGNTSGTTGIASGAQLRLVLAGGNNITLSQSLNGASGTITVSAFNQTAPVVSNALQSVSSATGSGTNTSRFAADDHVHAGVGPAGVSNIGNTSGSTAVLQGRLVLAGGDNITLSMSTSNNNAMTVTISAAAGGGAGYTAGMSNLSNTSGTTGVADRRLILAGGHNITLSQSLDAVASSGTITVSAYAPQLSIWYNAMSGAIGSHGTSNGTFFVFPLAPGVFPGEMTISTMYLWMSGSGNVSDANSYTWRFGLYTINGVSLSLLNSASSTWGFSADANNSQAFSGIRALTVHSSLWSAAPVLSQTAYYMGIVGHSSGSAQNLSFMDFRIAFSGVKSGTIGNSITSGNTTMGLEPWVGWSSASVSNTVALPSNIQVSELQKTGALISVVPLVVFNNVSSNF